MKTELFNQYAELKLKIKELEEEVEILAPQVLEEMGENEEVSSDFGTFVRANRRKWTYPEVLVEFEADVKAKKKQAEQVGDATYEEVPYLVFKSNKQ